MLRRLCRTACLLWGLVILVPQWVSATPDTSNQVMPSPRAEDYLTGMGHALRNLDYKGVFIYEQGGQKTSQQWVHVVRDGIERERLLGLDGAHREIIRERPSGCLPDGTQGIQAHLANVLSGKVVSLHTHYRISLGNPETVAGRTVRPVDITALDAFRYSYRLLADTETSLLLGADMLDRSGQLVERFRFISIFIGDVSDSDLNPVTASPTRMAITECAMPPQHNQSLQASWQFDMPGGYALCHVEVRQHNGGKEDVMMFSDGLNHLTVFVRHTSAPGQGGQLQEGNTLLRSETIELDGQYYAVTVVGEIPDVLARRVLSTAKPVSGN